MVHIKQFNKDISVTIAFTILDLKIIYFYPQYFYFKVFWVKF